MNSSQKRCGAIARIRLRLAAPSAKGFLLPLVALVVIIFSTGTIAPQALHANALASFATDAAPLLVTVVGSTLPILLGSIDLSIVGVASLATVLVVELNPAFGPWTSLCGIVLCAAIGALQGLIQAAAKIPSFVASLGTLGILTGFSLRLSHATSNAAPDNDMLLTLLGNSTFGVPNVFLTVVIIVALLAAIMHTTRFGRDVYALGTNERAAIMSGVKTLRVRVLVFALSAACASVGGLLLLTLTSFSSPALGGNLLLLAIVGVVVGGTAISGGVGGLVSGLLGGLITAWLRIATVLVGIDPATQGIVFGVMALVAVAMTTDRTKMGIVK